MSTITHYTKLDLSKYVGKTIRSIEVHEIFCREDEELFIVFTDDTKLVVHGNLECGETNLLIGDE